MNLEEVQMTISRNRKILNDIVDKLIEKYFADLDAVIKEVKELMEEEGELTGEDLNYYISYIPMVMYYAGNSLEDLGAGGDVAENLRKELYNTKYLNSTRKTVAEKTSDAQQEVINEVIYENAYRRAYKKAKLKLDYADSILNSLKKNLSWELKEYEHLN